MCSGKQIHGRSVATTRLKVIVTGSARGGARSVLFWRLGVRILGVTTGQVGKGVQMKKSKLRVIKSPGEPTKHEVHLADARDLAFLGTESVHLVCTSPPYGSLKEYPDHPGQLGNIASYEKFLDEMDSVWAECLRILVPGGRVACVVGDVCISRRKGGRHHVLPLAADIQVRARRLGFDNLTPVLWMKVANIVLEASRSSRFLGKPNLPNGIVKNDIEHILFLRKPGGYRKPTAEQEKR